MASSCYQFPTHSTSRGGRATSGPGMRRISADQWRRTCCHYIHRYWSREFGRLRRKRKSFASCRSHMASSSCQFPRHSSSPRGRATSGPGMRRISADQWRHTCALIYGDTLVASLDVYAGNGSSLPDVAVIWQVAPVSSLDIPPVGVDGRLPVAEWDEFPQTYAT